MPFNFDETNPSDGYLIPNYPGNARTFRALVKAALAIEHDTSEGRHKFGIGNTAARDAITTWVDGSIWFNTGLISGKTIMQIRSSSSWVTVFPSDEAFADQTETDAGTETQLAVSPATLAGFFSGGALDASTTAKGIIELAIAAEVAALTDTERAITPATLLSAFETGSDANGYWIKLPNTATAGRVCVQWGRSASGSENRVITLPETMADTDYVAFVSPETQANVQGTGTHTTTTFIGIIGGYSGAMRWVVVGYSDD